MIHLLIAVVHTQQNRTSTSHDCNQKYWTTSSSSIQSEGYLPRRCMTWAFLFWTQLHIAELSYRWVCWRGEGSLLYPYSNWGGIFTLCMVPETIGTMISLAQLLRWWFHTWRLRKDLKLFPSTSLPMEYSVLKAIVPLRKKHPLSPSLAPEMWLRDFAWGGVGEEASHKTDSF